MTYGNIKSRKKQDLTLSLENTFLEKSQGEGQIDLLAFFRFKEISLILKPALLFNICSMIVNNWCSTKLFD